MKSLANSYFLSTTFFLLLSILGATIINVPVDQPTIQVAIDSALVGDTILVATGSYYENINFNGKNIVVGSLFLTTNDSDFIAQTTIDGNQDGSVVQFVNGEDSTALLTGFTIANGFASPYGGGIYCSYSSPRLENLIVTGNLASSGGGIFCSMSTPRITNVTVQNNSASYGSGIYCYVYSDLVLENVTVVDNSAFGNGGGISTLYSNPTLVNVTISRNTAVEGSGIYCSNSEPIITNSILWNNIPQEINVFSGSVSVTYSDIQGGWPGEGNIQSNPLFCNPNANIYTLAENSPCLGTGLNGANMGALESGCDSLTVYEGPVWYVSDMGSDFFGVGSPDNPLATIQYAIHLTSNGDTVITLPGTYFENLNFYGKNVVVGSLFLTTEDTAYISRTVLNGRQFGSVVSFENGEDSTAVLSGFTLFNGSAGEGGGIYCDQSSPSLKHLVIYGNNAFMGSGIFCQQSNPNLYHVTVIGNSATNLGGALHCSDDSNPRLNSSIFWNNEPQEISFSDFGNSNSITVAYSDIMGSDSGIVTNNNGTVNWLAGNIDRDPIFCHPDNVNYTIAQNSPCLGSGSGGTHMGALNVGCDSILVDRSLWIVSASGTDSIGGGSDAYPFATIQFGINSTNANDTVLIQPGSYQENINFQGKKIIVGSLFLTTGDTGYISQTIIDGSQTGSVVTFENGEGITSMLKGVTLTNGFASTGGGIYCNQTSPNLVNLVIVRNSAASGGAIYCGSGANPSLLNITISDNAADDGGAIFCSESNPVLVNTILWDNAPQEIYCAADGGPSSIIVVNSDVMGREAGIVTNNNGVINWFGGNIDADPLFCDPDSSDYTLTSNSPCVGSGALGTNMGALNTGCNALAVEFEQTGLPVAYRLYQNYPNPFNPTTTLRYDLPERSDVILTIYDIRGREIVTLVQNIQEPGIKSVGWDGRNDLGEPVSAGVYFYKIQTIDFTRTRKMVVLR